MADDFEREVDAWLDQLEAELAPVGRHSTTAPDPGGAGEASQVAPRSSTPLSASTAALSDPPPAEALTPEHRETELERRRQDRARTEALASLMKQMAVEIRSLRRDVDRIKSAIGKLGRLVEAQRRAAGSAPPRPRPSS